MNPDDNPGRSGAGETVSGRQSTLELVEQMERVGMSPSEWYAVLTAKEASPAGYPHTSEERWASDIKKKEQR